jgi:sec-independent protein translocase protein TatA
VLTEEADMGELSPWHWLIVALVFVLLFGAKRLPDAARSLGQSLRIFKKEAGKLTGEEEPAAPQQPVAPAAGPQQAPAALSAEEQARRLEEQAAALRAQARTPQDQ